MRKITDVTFVIGIDPKSKSVADLKRTQKALDAVRRLAAEGLIPEVHLRDFYCGEVAGPSVFVDVDDATFDRQHYGVAGIRDFVRRVRDGVYGDGFEGCLAVPGAYL